MFVKVPYFFKMIIFYTLLVLPIRIFAANGIDIISGEAVYYAPSTVTMDEAKKIAVESAKLNALAEKYGTIISQNNLPLITNVNEGSDNKFNSLSSSEVKGEWL